MAQLKDLIVTGATRLIGNAYTGSIQITTLNAPTSAGGTTYGPGTNGYVLKSNGSSVYWGSDNNAGGTVTSVRVQATSPVTSSQNTAQTGTLNTTIALADGYGDTKNPYASKTKNYVLAAGATANSVPSFRALVEADIPALSWSKITSGNDDLKAIEALTGTSGLLKKTAANTWTLDTTAYTTNTGTVTSVRVQATSPVTSSVNTAQTGTLNTTIALADGYGDTKNPYASKTKNYVLAASATANSVPSFRALVAADIPTLSITDKTSGTLTVARGGTNNTAFTANRLVYGESASKLSSATSLYATASSLAINKTSITSGYNFEVSGKTYLNGMTLIKGLKGTSGIDYGEVLPDTAEEGQIFFQLSDVQYELPSGGTTGQFLRGDHSWSNELAGSFYAGTADTVSEYQIRVTGGAGSFYLYSQPSATGDRGIYSIDASNNLLPIITATNHNMVYFGYNGIAMDNNPSNYRWKQFIDSNHTTVCSRNPGANAFSQCAIEIRENNEVADGQSSIDYAPKLGFHWGNRCAGFIALNSSNWFDFKNQENNGWKGINVGGLTSYNGSINVQLQNVDASLANNNISGTIYPTSSNILDSAGRILTRQEAVLTSDGVIKSFWYVRNYNTSGNHIVQKGITLTANKDGSFRADCSSPFYGAVWNDYAEYRESNITEPGRCIKETGNGDLILTTKRLEKGCEIISDTFGFAIGQSDICKTPTAATGRVLAYLLEPIEEAKKNIGQAVCSGPNGTVSIMTDEECRLWPQCIIGTISEIPDYEIWHAGMQEGNKFEEIKVNGRIWIRVR